MKMDGPENSQPLKVRAGDGPRIQVWDSMRRVEAPVVLLEPGNVLHSLITSAPTHVGGGSLPRGGIREALNSGGAGPQGSEVLCCRRGTGTKSPPSSRGGGGRPAKPAKEPAEPCLSQSGGRGGTVAGSRSRTRARGHTHLFSVFWGAPPCCSGVGRGGTWIKSPSPSRGGGWPARNGYMEALS